MLIGFVAFLLALFGTMGTVQPSYAQEDMVFTALVREESVNEE